MSDPVDRETQIVPAARRAPERRARAWAARRYAVLGAWLTGSMVMASYAPAAVSIGVVSICMIQIARTHVRSAALDRGEFDDDVTRRRRRLERNLPGTVAHDWALAFLSYYELRQNRRGEAETGFRRLVELDGHPGLVTYATAELAACAALAGDVDQALAVLPRQSHPSLAPARAIVMARAGRHADVLAVAWEVPWMQLLGYGPRRFRHEGRVIALLHAFAEHQSGSPVRAALVARSCPAFAGEFTYLTADWPELATFVDGLRRHHAIIPTARATRRRRRD